MKNIPEALIVLLLMVLCLSPRAQGQMAPTTNTVNWSWIGNNYGDGPWSADIPITGNGTLSLGVCSGPDGANSDLLCTALKGGATIFTAASAPSTLVLGFDVNGCCIGNTGAFVGTTHANLTIVGSNGCSGNCVIAVTYVAIARTQLDQPVITSQSGLFNGCTATSVFNSWFFWDHDLCTFPPSQTPGGTAVFPGAGNSYTDGNFGTVVTQLNNPTYGNVVENMANDAAGSVWNIDSSYFMTQIIGGTFHVWDRVAKAIVYGDGARTFPGYVNWSPVDPKAFYYTTGSTIRKVTLGLDDGNSGGDPHSVWTDSLIFTYSGTGPIFNGSNDNITPDGYMSYFSNPDLKLCAVNLFNTSLNICTDPIDPAIWSTKGVRITPGFDSVTGYRYLVKGDSNNCIACTVHLIGDDWYKWKLGDTKIVHSHFQPKQRFYRAAPPAGQTANGGVCLQADYTAGGTGHCQPAAHEAFVEIGGREFVLTQFSGSNNPQIMQVQSIGTTDNMATPAEVGGGAYASFSTGINLSDSHVGCSDFHPVCVFENDTDVFDGGGSGGAPITWMVVGADNTGAGGTIHVKVDSAIQQPDWQATHAYTEGVVIRPLTGNAGFYTFSVAHLGDGTSGGSPPAWNQTPGGTTTDGTVTWTTIDVDSRFPPKYPGANGDNIWITGIFGISGLTSQAGNHGKCTIANLAADHRSWDCSGTTPSGTWTAATGIVLRDILPAANSYQAEILFFDYTNLFTSHTYGVKRVAKHRSITYTDRYSSSGYYSQGHPNVSPDGKHLLWNTNMGYPDELVLMMADTGYVPPPAVTGTVINGNTVLRGKIVLP